MIGFPRLRLRMLMTKPVIEQCGQINFPLKSAERRESYKRRRTALRPFLNHRQEWVATLIHRAAFLPMVAVSAIGAACSIETTLPGVVGRIAQNALASVSVEMPL